MSETIDQMRARLEAYDRAASEQADNQALASAIEASGVPIKPGVLGQVSQLLRGDIKRGVLDGQSVVCGPGGVPLAQHVAAKLASPEFGHFVQPAASQQAPQFSRPSAPQVQGAAYQISQELRGLTGMAGGAGAGSLPDGARSVGAQIVAAVTRPPVDASGDMSRPFGLRPLR